MKAEIVCVGTELLLGDIVNTNAVFLARELAAAGIRVYHQCVVGDNARRLEEVLRAALARADIVVTSGGLGPTYDDLTKETAAKLFDREMEMNEEELAHIREVFAQIGRPMTSNNEKQALMPRGAHVLRNNNGTAPGLMLEKDGKALVLLPGPPRELEPMFLHEALPLLRRGEQHMLVSRNVHIFGMGESAVEEALRDIMEASQNPTIAPYAKEGEVLLRVTAYVESEEEAEKLLAPAVEEIRRQLGDHVIYGIDVGSLQQALVSELAARGMTVAAAESCTGGMVAQRITAVPGASEVFGYGVCTYANGAKEELLGVSAKTLKQYGAVSRQTAAEMAEGVRRLSGADIGVSTTGVAGPGGGSKEKPVGLVYIGVSSGAYSDVFELHLGRGYSEQREMIRYVAASHALWAGLRAARATGQ